MTYMTGFDKGQLLHTHWQDGLFTTNHLISTSMNYVTNHVCIIANGSLVCFSWGLFLGPVWHAQVPRWSSNGSGVVFYLCFFQITYIENNLIQVIWSVSIVNWWCLLPPLNWLVEILASFSNYNHFVS